MHLNKKYYIGSVLLFNYAAYVCLPALTGLKFGSENLSHNDTIIETIPNTTTTDR